MDGKFSHKRNIGVQEPAEDAAPRRSLRKPLLITGCSLCAAAILGLGGLALRSIDIAPEKPAAEAVPETQVTVPETLPSVVTPDGKADSILFRADYTDSDSADADRVVATAGKAQLTNRQLQLLYAMEVAACRSAETGEKPDFSQPLAQQARDDSSWQHYFLQKALSSWHTRQALLYGSSQPQLIAEEFYEPNEERHEKYFSDDLPAAKLLYGDKECFTPNSVHQEYLDSIPDGLNELAAQRGYADADAMAQAMCGASAGDLAQSAEELNRAYMYYTELSYNVQPDEEAIAAAPAGQEQLVDMLHLLLVPENATVGSDMTVSASDEDWDKCMRDADALLTSYRKNWRISREGGAAVFSEVANKNSADPGSRLCGGRYSALRKGQLIDELDSWCFAPERQAGDIEIIRTRLGVHIVYFDRSYTDAEPQTRQALVWQALEEKVEALKKDCPMEVDFSAVSLTAPGADITADDLLYPDIAHQQYPQIPLYLQQDFPNAMFGFRNVAKGGCGITTLAMISTYLADRTLSPATVGAMFGAYCTKAGTDGMIFANAPSTMGYFMERNSWNWDDIEQAIRDGKIVVSLQYPGYFTSAGHYMALEEVTEDGRIVVRDSNIFNYAKLEGHKVDCFDHNLITAASQVYWIYEPKIVRIPACARCGDMAHSDIPGQLLQQDYTCPKCTAALTRRNGFLNLNAQ